MKNRKKNQDGKGLGRREFLKVSLAAGASLAAPMIFTRSASAQQERVLKIVQWKHFVPDWITSRRPISRPRSPRTFRAAEATTSST